MARIGDRLPRIEDPPLLTGRGAFVADLNRPGQVHMRIVRSPVAFGRLLAVDSAAARAMPGVAAVWTADDFPDLPPIDFRMTRIEGLGPYRQGCLARDWVRYVGDPVALVLAETAAGAEDAAEAVFCDIDELAPVLDARQPPAPFLPGTDSPLSTEPAVIRKATGDLAAAFAAAAHLVEVEAHCGRHSGVPLETRGALAVPDGEGGVTMYGAAKVPHYNRDAIARMLGLPRDRVQLSEGHVGGGFGIRGELYPEDVLACACALRTGRPVKWIEDRREHLIAANHSRDQHYRLRAAVDAQGVILGLDAAFVTDQGAYVRTHGGTVSDLSAALLPGPYRIPAYRVEGRIRLTNKTPAGTYRAPGRYESTFARERLIDAVARRLGLDRLEVRRRNLIPEAAIPFDRGLDALGTPVVYDSARFAALLDRLAAHVDWQETGRRLAARRAAGELAGMGVGCFVEKSGLGPDELARIEVPPAGGLRIVTGAASLGQGLETALAQIAADALGIGIGGIEVIHGQTDRIDRGIGGFATRVTVMTGSAVHLAAAALIAGARAAAAELLQCPPEAVIWDAGQVRHPESGRTLSLAEIAALRPGGLSAEGDFRSDHMTYPYGLHFAQVRIDPGTGGVTIERYAVAFDVGRAVNPMLVEGQITGAALQGIGGALYEEFRYDEGGQPLAASLADYLMPTAAEMPPVEVLLAEDAPSPINPLGVKGAGEGGITGAGAAIAAALDDALGGQGLIDRLPVTPAALHALLGARRAAPP